MERFSTSDLSNIGIVGSGPTALYLLKYILDEIDVLKGKIRKITIFERENILGMGMPYRPTTTDIYNLANISSEEIPLLKESFSDWLRKQDKEYLKELNITKFPIDDKKVYSRISLGHYFENQLKKLILDIRSFGIEVIEIVGIEVLDLSVSEDSAIIVIDKNHTTYNFSTVVIANGHEWKDEDKPESGYFASPWPIHKLIPQKNEKYNFPVGILGASLSAFDVVTSLSHRHGTFETVDGNLKYYKNEENPHFKLILHSSEGWLPHLQYEQQEPIREIYRHFDRNQLLDLINGEGLLRIEDYFDKLCRLALINAFTKYQLVQLMSDKHHYVDSFEGMKLEMKTAKNSVYNDMPINWMETLDDLMYSLNYHAELLPAEDHQYFHQEIMSFLMNVIAALPLQSAEILLALYDADCIELKTGRVNFPDNSFTGGKTKIEIEQPDEKIEKEEYKLFVNCSGGHKLEIENYPFISLVEQGVVRSPEVEFVEEKKKRLKLSGIDINSCYRTINKEGKANSFLYDINFTHTNGLRPYSYGLQACSATSLILVESWVTEIKEGINVGKEIETITELYEDIEGL
jgi:hypothetical protein